MSPALPVVSGKEVIRALEKAGFAQVSQRGAKSNFGTMLVGR